MTNEELFSVRQYFSIYTVDTNVTQADRFPIPGKISACLPITRLSHCLWPNLSKERLVVSGLADQLSNDWGGLEVECTHTQVLNQVIVQQPSESHRSLFEGND